MNPTRGHAAPSWVRATIRIQLLQAVDQLKAITDFIESCVHSMTSPCIGVVAVPSAQHTVPVVGRLPRLSHKYAVLPVCVYLLGST